MKKITILLVEDDRWLAELETRVLEHAGYQVVHVTHGEEAMAAVDERHPQVLIVDVLLAGGTAFPLLHELQSYDDTGALPIILCTNAAEQLEATDLSTYGVRRIVNKSTMVPIDLVAAVRSVVV